MKKIFILSVFLSFILCNYSFAKNYDISLPLPGLSMANTKLQYDTLFPVYMAVGTKTTNCEDMKVVDTKVTKQPYGLKYREQQAIGGAWEELWSVNACSQIYNVPIKFILDETGASYVISPEDIISK